MDTWYWGTTYANKHDAIIWYIASNGHINVCTLPPLNKIVKYMINQDLERNPGWREYQKDVIDASLFNLLL